MRHLLFLSLLLLYALSVNSQKKLDDRHILKTGYVLNPFNGMHSGFKANGTANKYSAQVTTLNGLVSFTPQTYVSNPIHPFGVIRMLYDQKANDDLIQLTFTLPPNKAFQIELSVETQVNNSTFNFKLDTITIPKPAKLGPNIISAIFNGNATGRYLLFIDPEYQRDFTTFFLTEIKIKMVN